MIQNSLDNMQHDNILFDDDVQLEALAAPLSPFEIDLKHKLVTLNSFEANNHDFQHNLTFSIDLFCFQSHPLSNKKSSFSSTDLCRNAFLDLEFVDFNSR